MEPPVIREISEFGFQIAGPVRYYRKPGPDRRPAQKTSILNLKSAKI
jgi:hypothetical protein